MADAEERTEPATSKRRDEARKKGQVARSTEIGSAMVLLMGFTMLWAYGKYIYEWLAGYMKWMLSPTMFVTSSMNPNFVGWLFEDMYAFVIRVLAPLVAAIMVVGLAFNLVQVGFRVSFTPISPNFSKLNPLSGVKRLFSFRAIQELAKSLIKLSIVATISYQHVKAEIPTLLLMHDMDIAASMALVSGSTIRLIMKLIMVLVVIAILDWIYQKYDFEKSLKMSKQEVKDEYKQREGDPLVRSRIRQKQREIAVRRMMAEVPKADVVITNPIRIAVALTYVADEMHAPKVVAKGAGVIAERIREVAKENEVPIIEDRALAQALFKTAEIGDFVPPNLFKAVAEILAYVYRLGRKEHSFGL